MEVECQDMTLVSQAPDDSSAEQTNDTADRRNDAQPSLPGEKLVFECGWCGNQCRANDKFIPVYRRYLELKSQNRSNTEKRKGADGMPDWIRAAD
jgi:hypothetical protein